MAWRHADVLRQREPMSLQRIDFARQLDPYEVAAFQLRHLCVGWELFGDDSQHRPTLLCEGLAELP